MNNNYINVEDSLPECTLNFINKHSVDCIVTDGDNYYIAFLEAVRPDFTYKYWTSVETDEILDGITHWKVLDKL
jgi:hypothetical protein